MVSTYSPTYYTSLHDSITSICRSILPFPFKKKKRLTVIAAAEQRLEKQQLENLKWQQDSFHQILRLMGLCKEGIINEVQVRDFRAHILENLISSPAAVDYEACVILKDKLTFLQELLFVKCISEEEYDAAKKPLVVKLEGQGAEKDVIVWSKSKDEKKKTEEEASSVTALQLGMSSENPFWNVKDGGPDGVKPKRKTWGFVQWGRNPPPQ